MELQRGKAAQAIEQLQTASRYEAAAEFWLWRELKALRWYVTVGARTPVPTELLEIAAIEGCTTSRHRITRFVVAVELRRLILVRVLPEARPRSDDGNRTEEGEQGLEGDPLESIHGYFVSDKAKVNELEARQTLLRLPSI